MKKINLISLLLLTVLFTLASCSEKADDPAPVTNTSILTAKTWKVATLKGDGADITDDPSMVMFKSMRFKFNTNGTYTQTLTGFSGNGNWVFENNESVLVFDKNTTTEERWEVTELKSNSLKISTDVYYEEDGVPGTMLFEVEMVYVQ